MAGVHTELESVAVSKTSMPEIKFGTDGWRGLIADDFTFANVRLAVTAIVAFRTRALPRWLAACRPRRWLFVCECRAEVSGFER